MTSERWKKYIDFCKKNEYSAINTFFSSSPVEA